MLLTGLRESRDDETARPSVPQGLPQAGYVRQPLVSCTPTHTHAQTYVFCCAHAEQIKTYLAESKWAAGGFGARQMKVSTIVSTVCSSAGEALRMIDQRDIIKSEFVLVSGDTVSNMKLGPALELHRARRAADKNAIMTMVGWKGKRGFRAVVIAG